MRIWPQTGINHVGFISSSHQLDLTIVIEKLQNVEGHAYAGRYITCYEADLHR